MKLLLVVVVVFVVVEAIEHDAPYYHWEEKKKGEFLSDGEKVKEKLSALREKYGTPPNIVYILADDVGWGELGSYLGGALRGTPSPVLDKVAAGGIQFLSAYSEPTCTPTRISLLTGRQPTRTGFTTVPFPGNKDGLVREEVTVAEVLSQKGYATAMYGKWHVGESQEQAPENQGFDQALYGLYNGGPFAWEDSYNHYGEDRKVASGAPFFYDYPGNKAYDEEYNIEVQGIFSSKKGEGRKEIMTLNSSLVMEDLERMSIEEIEDFIKTNSKAKKPFFVYWATYFQQLASSPSAHRHGPGVDSRNNQASQLGQHEEAVQRLIDLLEKEGIAENTLLVWYSDNGPMYGFWPTGGYTWLRGGKGSTFEGGVRVPAFASWPGMIEPGQKSLDIMHVSDLFTTAAVLSGAEEYVPRDRVIDGIDQSALFLLGSGHSHRNYVIHYSGNQLQAVRHGEYKLVFLNEDFAGYKKPELYNIIRDPAEKMPQFYQELHMLEPFMQLIQAHKLRKNRFPDRKPQRFIPSGYDQLAHLFAPKEVKQPQQHQRHDEL
eukprot:CAMPEP_0201514294 /NCGR_PEP_ID=MMETSP0161_2-20130828/6147_1 /ASSEMBLY_ACC=CAM_ASM_000251 /TAXON_ID=180227 /ORGANISM="Neoparamoeba aestuarina, Strain SoJaBio B1-5/56/2" /LENGTH=544 /DNA_ID=CAMNT_0047910809 /DNA_START=209 /DNA_END=1843 /DNA_ORIENTATION=-